MIFASIGKTCVVGRKPLTDLDGTRDFVSFVISDPWFVYWDCNTSKTRLPHIQVYVYRRRAGPSSLHALPTHQCRMDWRIVSTVNNDFHAIITCRKLI